MSTSPTTRAATGIAPSARGGRQGVAGRTRGRAVAVALLPRRVHRAGADRRHRPSEQGRLHQKTSLTVTAHPILSGGAAASSANLPMSSCAFGVAAS